MNINLRSHSQNWRSALFLASFVMLLLCLTSCALGKNTEADGVGSAGAGRGTRSSAKGAGTVLTVSGEELRTLHFSTFELSVPSDWTERGNTNKVLEPAEDDLFLLVGIPEAAADGTVQPFETALEESLELFFPTEFYRNRVQVSYVTYPVLTGGLTRVSGTWQNERTGEELWFTGAYGVNPDVYFIYAGRSDDTKEKGSALMEAAYESFRVL